MDTFQVVIEVEDLPLVVSDEGLVPFILFLKKLNGSLYSSASIAQLF